ncbi:MAG: TIGR04053 family radical SAM/SPASM domain-containing protein [Candidatus Promineifilaceae bacterium]|nr:TIGR04053 family radical SAM/SPASM domain-containing protein [Candidatus Promineifilaceae bacterium]
MIATEKTELETTEKKQLAIGPGARFIYDRAPMLVYWEATRACALACLHCRAEAVAQRHPLEMRTEEVRALFRQIVGFGGRRLPHLVITGGDPLERPDLFELIVYGRSLNIPISITPAGTSRLTPEVVEQFASAGVLGLGLSLDGSNSERHDSFRGEPGSFGWTVEAAKRTRAAGMPLQVNTMVTAQTLDDIPAIYEVVREIGATRWALFFLIATGRGEELASITPEESERFLNWLMQVNRQAPFPIKTTEAHHYRRIAYLKMQSQGMGMEEILQSPVGRAFGIRDGNGVVFVSHVGQVYPSGFLPYPAGNVRRQNLVDIYRENRVFRDIRNPEKLGGKCGRCEFRALCGGSRARAYADSGDYLGEDPLCPYQPRARAQV